MTGMQVRARDAAFNWSAWSTTTYVTTTASGSGGSPDVVWLDLNGDGIRDEIIRAGSSGFNAFINNWWTECYDYESYDINYYWDPWGYNWGGSSLDTPGFSRIWDPDPFWRYSSSYSYCYTDVEPAVSFQTEAGYEYRLYEDFSGSTDFNFNNWYLHFASSGFGTGSQFYSLGWWDADYFYMGQLFLARMGKPLNYVQVNIPGVGALGVGSNGVLGSLTLPGGGTLNVNTSGGSVSFPGGPTVTATSGAVSVSGAGTVSPGGTVTVGGVTVHVDASGNATVTYSGTELVIDVSGGGRLTFPGGIGVEVSPQGEIGLILPQGIPPVIAQVLDTANRILSGDALGAALILKDFLGIETRIPTPIGDIDIEALTNGGQYQLGIERGFMAMWFTKGPKPRLEPITLSGGIPPKNPSGFELNTQATFEIGLNWFSGVSEDQIVWTASPGLSFVNGDNKGKTVTVTGTSAVSSASLEVDIPGFTGPKPTVTTNVYAKNTVQLHIYVVRENDGSSPATTPTNIANMIAQANAIFKQAAIEFVQDGGINYIDNSALLEISNENDWAEAKSLTSTHSNTGGLEVYFVDKLGDNSDPLQQTAGLHITSGGAVAGLIIADIAPLKALAHEIGHACGWPDIYVRRRDSQGNEIASLPYDKVKQAWLPDDWNNGPGPAYYSTGLRHRDLVEERLLMHGHGGDSRETAIVIPRGAVYGLPKDSSTPAMLAVGLSTMNRNPQHP